MDAAQIDQDLRALRGLVQRLSQHLDQFSHPQMDALTAILLDLAPVYQGFCTPDPSELLQPEISRPLEENRRARALLEAIFMSNPGGLAVLTGPDLTFAFANHFYRLICPQMGRNITGLSYRQVWEDGLDTCFVDQVRQTLETGQPFIAHDYTRSFEDGSLRTFSFQVRRMQWDEQPAALVALWDVTEHKQAEEALRQSEKRYQDLIQYAPAGIYEVDFVRKRFISVNDRMCALTGYSREELLGMSPFDLLDENGRTLFQERINRWLSGKKPLENVEYHVQAKDGHDIYALLNVTFRTNETGLPIGATVVGFDVSDQKRAQEELMVGKAQIEVQRRLLDQREQERLQIARDLHDGPIQDLIGTVIELKSLSDPCDGQELIGQVKSIQGRLQAIIAEMRAFTQNLRPPVLSTFGLVKAIRTHLETFTARHPETDFRFEAHFEANLLTENVRLALFRIYQEALNNVVKHSHATEVTVRLEKEGDMTYLEIRDNGRGFDMPGDWLEIARQGHLGLVGMRERAEAVGGRMAIESSPGAGTILRVWVPLT